MHRESLGSGKKGCAVSKTVEIKAHFPEPVQKRENRMIRVTRFNGTKLFVNAELVQTVEGRPDTVISLINGTKLLVKEPAANVVEMIISYHQKVRNPIWETATGD